MRTYLISVERAVERRSRMAALLDAQAVPFEWVPAVDNRTGADRLAAEFAFHDRTTATDAEMVCVLSHMEAWETFLRTDAPAALFLEDDLHFAPAFADVVAQLRVDAEADAILRLETCLATVTADRRPTERLRSCAIYEIHSNHGGTAAYVLSRAMARRLLAQRRGFRHAIDTELFDRERSSLEPVRVLQCFPAPCIQDEKLFRVASEPFLASHVGNNRHDYISGRDRAEKPVVRLVKALVRPVYVRGLSLALGLRGKRRVVVPYG